MRILFFRILFILLVAGALQVTVIGTASITGPDIIGTRLAFPTPVHDGEVFELQDFIRNQGSDPASSFLIEYYISPNPEQTEEKILIGTWQIPGLKAGAGKIGNTTIMIPPGTVPGEYFLIRWIDPASVLSGEISSNNMQRSKNPITILSGIPSGLYGIGTIAPANAQGGSQIPVSVMIGNEKDQETEPVTVYLFLSSTTTPDSSGIEVGSVQISSVPPKGDREVQGSLDIPADIVPGTYYLFTSLIPVDMIAKEENPSRYWFNEDPIQITTIPSQPDKREETVIPAGTSAPGADVVGIETILPDEAFIGAAFQITDKIQNNGGSLANIVRVQYLLSENTDGTNGGHLGWWTTMNLKPGQTVSEQKLLGIPSNTRPGLYYLAKKITVTGSIPDNSGDKVWVSNRPISVRYNPADPIPDVTHIKTLWPTGQPGESVQIVDTITNIGRACTEGVSVAYYISPYSQFDAATASYLGVWTVDSICPGEQKTQATSVTLPSDLSNGEYYFYSVINPCWFISDCGDGFPELDTSNNINAGRFVIGPCLLCS